MVAVTIAYCTQNNVHLNNSATKLGHFPAREHLHLSSYTHYENDIEKCNRGSRAYKSTSHINREYYRRYSAMYKTPAGNSSATAAISSPVRLQPAVAPVDATYLHKYWIIRGLISLESVTVTLAAKYRAAVTNTRA